MTYCTTEKPLRFHVNELRGLFQVHLSSIITVPHVQHNDECTCTKEHSRFWKKVIPNIWNIQFRTKVHLNMYSRQESAQVSVIRITS